MQNTPHKIAHVTLAFWIMKIVATTLGETLGDFLSMTLNLGYLTGIAITAVFFVAILIVQLRAKKFIPLVFWSVIISTTTLGTEISDFIDRSLHLGYTIGSLILVAGLLATFYFWYQRFSSLDVSEITNRTKEVYFWIAVLFSNSLGTAFGDYLGDVIGLTYSQGAFFTAIIIAVVVLLHYFTQLNRIFLFWTAFIFTRPFGATFGDFMTKPVQNGGLNLGTLEASIVAVVIMAITIFLAHKQLNKEKGSH